MYIMPLKKYAKNVEIPPTALKVFQNRFADGYKINPEAQILWQGLCGTWPSCKNVPVV